MSLTTLTPTANIEGFSQILKEQSGEKKYLGVFIAYSFGAKVEFFQQKTSCDSVPLILYKQTWCFNKVNLKYVLRYLDQ